MYYDQSSKTNESDNTDNSNSGTITGILNTIRNENAGFGQKEESTQGGRIASLLRGNFDFIDQIVPSSKDGLGSELSDISLKDPNNQQLDNINENLKKSYDISEEMSDSIKSIVSIIEDKFKDYKDSKTQFGDAILNSNPAEIIKSDDYFNDASSVLKKIYQDIVTINKGIIRLTDDNKKEIDIEQKTIDELKKIEKGMQEDRLAAREAEREKQKQQQTQLVLGTTEKPKEEEKSWLGKLLGMAGLGGLLSALFSPTEWLKMGGKVLQAVLGGAVSLGGTVIKWLGGQMWDLTKWVASKAADILKPIASALWDYGKRGISAVWDAAKSAGGYISRGASALYSAATGGLGITGLLGAKAGAALTGGLGVGAAITSGAMVAGAAAGGFAAGDFIAEKAGIGLYGWAQEAEGQEQKAMQMAAETDDPKKKLSQEIAALGARADKEKQLSTTGWRGLNPFAEQKANEETLKLLAQKQKELADLVQAEKQNKETQIIENTATVDPNIVPIQKPQNTESGIAPATEIPLTTYEDFSPNIEPIRMNNRAQDTAPMLMDQHVQNMMDYQYSRRENEDVSKSPLLQQTIDNSSVSYVSGSAYYRNVSDEVRRRQ